MGVSKPVFTEPGGGWIWPQAADPPSLPGGSPYHSAWAPGLPSTRALSPRSSGLSAAVQTRRVHVSSAADGPSR